MSITFFIKPRFFRGCSPSRFSYSLISLACHLFAAIRVSPPDYITAELGERPSDPGKRAEWDQGVKAIEGYRKDNGVGDRDSALGRKPKEVGKRMDWELARERVDRSRMELGRARARERVMEIGRDSGIGL